MKGVYLGACFSRHPNYDIIYNDIDSKYNCDLTCDMLTVDLSLFDFIIATPPCNYYSVANYRRNVSNYALSTKHLLPGILLKCCLSGKPFIIENVRNLKLFVDCGIIDICEKYGVFVYFIGRHTYFTNVMCNLHCNQVFDDVVHKQHCCFNSLSYRQGGVNVFNVLEIWLSYIKEVVYGN